MFDVGFSELVLLFVIGLLVLGPQRLPKVAAEIGKWVGRARRTATQLRRQLEREIELNDIQPPRPPPAPPPPAAATPPAPAAAAATATDDAVAPLAEAPPAEAPPASVADSPPPVPEPADKPPQT